MRSTQYIVKRTLASAIPASLGSLVCLAQETINLVFIVIGCKIMKAIDVFNSGQMALI